jgi:hypothetical protein
MVTYIAFCALCHNSAVGRDGQAAPRSGFFHNFGKREILVKKWDKAMEGKEKKGGKKLDYLDVIVIHS